MATDFGTKRQRTQSWQFASLKFPNLWIWTGHIYADTDLVFQGQGQACINLLTGAGELKRAFLADKKKHDLIRLLNPSNPIKGA